jgi:hypothetical protein
MLGLLLLEFSLQQEGVGGGYPPICFETGLDDHPSSRTRTGDHSTGLKPAARANEDHLCAIDCLDGTFRHRHAAGIDLTRGADTCLQERTGLQAGGVTDRTRAPTSRLPAISSVASSPGWMRLASADGRATSTCMPLGFTTW